MRAFVIAIGALAFCSMNSPVAAADMQVPHKEMVRAAKAPVAEAVCLRWVETNYSWYNYCDQIPYYPRKDYYHRFGELF